MIDDNTDNEICTNSDNDFQDDQDNRFITWKSHKKGKIHERYQFLLEFDSIFEKNDINYIL